MIWMRGLSIGVPLAAAVVDLTAVVVVLAGAKEQRAAWAFGLMTASFAAWHLLLVACSIPEASVYHSAILASLRCGQIFAPAAAFHCAFVWSGSMHRWARIMLRLGYLIALLLVCLHARGLLIDGFRPTVWGGIIAKPGLVYPGFVAFCLVLPAMAIVLCWRSHRAALPAQVKLRSRYWLLGAAVAFPLGVINLLANYGFEIVMPSGIGNISMVGIVGNVPEAVDPLS